MQGNANNLAITRLTFGQCQQVSLLLPQSREELRLRSRTACWLKFSEVLHVGNVYKPGEFGLPMVQSFADGGAEAEAAVTPGRIGL